MKKTSAIKKIINLSPLVDVFMIVIFWYIMFSNQNLAEQEAASQYTLEDMKSRYEETIEKLEINLDNAMKEKADTNTYIEELLAELESLKEKLSKLEAENEALKQSNAELKAENEKLAGLMEQEGKTLLLQLTGGTESLRILECTYEGKVERFAFTTDERDGLKAFVEDKIMQYVGAGNRMNVLFLYEGINSYSKDIAVITETIEQLQKEEYFVYSKINLSR
ncbi:MAG: hypothetical protein ACI4FZ_02965 [Lachnospiraceae bacterium]